MTGYYGVEINWVDELHKKFAHCQDLTVEHIGGQMTIFFFRHLLDYQLFQSLITSFFQDADDEAAIERLLQVWNPITGHNQQDIISKFVEKVLRGEVGGVWKGKLYTIAVGNPVSRVIMPSDRESVITGPHDAFTEDWAVNISLIRRRIQSSHLKTIKHNIGSEYPIDIYMLYIDGTAEKGVIDEAIRRVEKIQVSQALDGNVLAKRLDDSPFSVFPQWLGTERPDIAADQLKQGKVAIITSNSPTAIIAPAHFLDFFSVSGDAYERWHFSVFIRMLRIFVFVISLLLSAFYVAITTYHYQFIPSPLLQTMIQARYRVPFDPMIEAFMIEGVVELLREAGARLPSKIAQTIGIVGGLVIGQAIVQAGLVSDFLIVAVAASALASFIVPNYTMETSMRLFRFLNILLAGFLGYFGIFLFVTLFITHLCHIRTLSKEYLMLYRFPRFIFLSEQKLPKVKQMITKVQNIRLRR
ncbi:spore germination protein [Paenibacillus sp. 1001270B_150601_E10]|uniref:spore germination protein n=1 Tax=Paenibacillus sp. 1001270B_150601_E10 TaxID=2787079 RepID=UPI0018A0F81E|nr:spore germination protein [Paenibacillus sp. 1001270B_150601_E10]